MRKKFALALMLVLLPALVHAQFFTDGSGPGSVRWMQRNTDNYTIIYPVGMDSLACLYATELERVLVPVGGSIGYTPNCKYGKRMPVVLHPFTSYGNGSVTWAPRRMDLLTTPDAYSIDPTPWIRQLAVHESRHVAQMQAGAEKHYGWLKVLTGELTAGAIAGVYGGPAFLEGDAVVAETSLTGGGRGRSGNFLEYQRACFTDGDMRNYWKWLYGSQRYYTPDHYKIGYLTLAGMTSLYGNGNFSEHFYRRISEHGGVAFWNMQKTTRELSGKPFDEAWDEVASHLRQTWEAENEARGPFTPAVQFTPTPRRFADYHGCCMLGDRIYAIRTGLDFPTEIVKITPDGTQKRIGGFASITSDLHADHRTGRIFWSENVADPRWEKRSYSLIRCLDADGRVFSLTHGTRYFNPSPSPYANEIAVTEYPAEGGSRVIIIDSFNGKARGSFKDPEGRQITETAWACGQLFAVVTGEGGMALVNLTDGSTVLPESFRSIRQLRGESGHLTFVSDMNGVNEIFLLDPVDGRPVRIVGAKNGAADYMVLGDKAFFSSMLPEGRMLFSCDLASLDNEIADISKSHGWVMTDELTAAEPGKVPEQFSTQIGEARKYSKAGHLFRFHSWAPVWVNFDAVSSMSMENLLSAAGIGATVFFQNTLGDFYGQAGVNLFDNSFNFRPSFHAKATWTGLYPVFELSADINDRNARSYSKVTEDIEGRPYVSLIGLDAGKAFAGLSLKTYIPLDFSRGGLKTGVVPQLNFSLGNDIYHPDETSMPMTRAAMSLRAYIMRKTASSCIYPKLGIGTEIGYSMRPGMTDLFCSNGFAFVYGYLPGFAPSHGTKLSVLYEKLVSDGIFCEPYASVVPRGPGGTELSYALSRYPYKGKLSIDYAIPFAPLDWSGLCPVAYLRNLELIPHFDWCFFGGRTVKGSIYSAGASLSARLGNLLWIPYTTRIGIRYDYNGGPSFEMLKTSCNTLGHHSINMVFDIEL